MVPRLALAGLSVIPLMMCDVSATEAHARRQPVPSSPSSLAPGTSFPAKLITDLDCISAKAGDVVEAQVVENVKNGDKTVLKKGSRVVGHVAAVQPPTTAQPRGTVGIIFDSVVAKGSESAALHTIIVALAPEADVTPSSLSEGRGMGGLTDNATVSGQADAGQRRELRRDAVGVIGFPGVELGTKSSSAGTASLVSWSTQTVKIKKGSQLVLRVVSQ